MIFQGLIYDIQLYDAMESMNPHVVNVKYLLFRF